MNAGGGRTAAAKPDRFIWPPRPLADPTLPTAPEPPTARPPIRFPELELAPPGRLGALRCARREVEAAWLGFTAAPLAVRAAEAGWAPDGSDAYCPRCGLTVGVNEVSPSGAPGRPAGDCPQCRRRNLPWERMVRLGEHAGLLRDLVHEIKFTAWRQVGMDVGRMLGRSLAGALSEAGVDGCRTVLVAMPTTYARRMGRGIDHARVIARGVREVTGIPIVRALDRSHRRSQLAVPLSGRAANVAGSFAPIPGVDLGGLTVVVVDDVRTTGATMAAACRALAECGQSRAFGRGESVFDRGGGRIRIWAAVAAVASQPGRRKGGEAEIVAEGSEKA